MKKFTLLSLFVGVISIGLPTIASAWTGHRGGDLDIDILTDRGAHYQMYPVREAGYNSDTVKAYLEARPGEPYKIRVRNRSGERVGLVIAVDGRNAISGKKSYLRANERMYVLGPYQSATYKGWRTGSNRVNEFYFTDELDSYAGAFGDYSAMGVISVAVFDEKRRYTRRDEHEYDHDSEGRYGDGYKRGPSAGGKQAPSAKNNRSAPKHKNADPGTGFGDERYSPSRAVEFQAQRHASSTWLIKYEWRDTLCEKGIARCAYARNDNRMWPDRDGYRHNDGYRQSFAPPPPGRSNYRYKR